VIVGLGGGTTTDLAGFAAATYMRGIDWVAVPTSLVGQVDAAIGGKTAIDLPEAKNLVGAFHWPARTVIDPALLATLPEDERRNGLAEVVKTGLLAGERPEPPDQNLCGAVPRTQPCLRAPTTGRATPQPRPHVRARARGVGAPCSPHGKRGRASASRPPLRLSGDTAPVDEAPTPEPVGRPSAPGRRCSGDKKGRLRIVLLDDDGAREEELPEADVRGRRTSSPPSKVPRCRRS
jgi:hypothetical protein